LGLNLCLKFIERMNGQIWVTNKPDRGGACFCFALPVVSHDKRSVPPTPSITNILTTPLQEQEKFPMQHQATGMSSGEGLKILLVDDTLINLKVLARMLKCISSSHRVTTVDSGAKGLNELHKDHFDLVITDIQMPEMDGVEFARRIRTGGFPSKPVVVALTAETSEALYRRCEAVGIAFVLHKPISNAQFREFFDRTLHNLAPCVEK